MKGIKIAGVPLGIKWINEFLVLIKDIWINKATQKGRASVSVKDIWLDAVKIPGNNPGILLQIINIKILIEKINIWGYFLISGLNSFVR